MAASFPLVVAIDGFAAAGKGTLGKNLGQAMGWAYLDTGSTYRAVALAVLKAGQTPDDRLAAAAAAKGFTPESYFALMRESEGDLRTPPVSDGASKVARFEEVRSILRSFQRQFALHPPAGFPGATLDGRDIGTEVCPEAPVKLFVTARIEIRTARVLQALRQRGIEAIESDVMRDLNARDLRDSTSPIGRLRPADDAVMLDTSDMSVPEVLDAALAVIRKKLPDMGV